MKNDEKSDKNDENPKNHHFFFKFGDLSRIAEKYMSGEWDLKKVEEELEKLEPADKEFEKEYGRLMRAGKYLEAADLTRDWKGPSEEREPGPEDWESFDEDIGYS